jgi:glutamyl-tRNA synthetase
MSTTSTVRTRFAPSPTGYMHIGNLRTALYAFLTARKADGSFILRIEDTDQERKLEDSLAVIYRSLELAGLEYDEGPDKGGEYGPYVQSERLDIYPKYIEQLIEKGDAYRCFCTKEELEARRSAAETDDEKYRYDGLCRSLSEAEIEAKMHTGMPFVVRQKMMQSGTTTYTDHVFGEITIENAQLDDQVLLKSDGYPTYNFANVIDDHLMGITHVIRGHEYLSSTPKYNHLYRSFGWEIPEYVHLPLIVKESGKKLSKREGDASFEDFLAKGYLPEAIVNYIALLGWNPGTEQEYFTLDGLIEAFDIDRINNANAAFSEEKLRWLNGLHIREMDGETFHTLVLERFPEGLADRIDTRLLAELLQKRTESLNDIPEQVDFLMEMPDFDPELYSHKKMKTSPEKAAEILPGVIEIIEKIDGSVSSSEWTNERLYTDLAAYAQEQGLKNGTVLWPLRVALSGLPQTPGGGTELAVILGKEETVRRLRQAVAKLKG